MDAIESMDKNVVIGALFALIVCLVAFKGFAAPKEEEVKTKEPSQVQVPKTVPSRSRKMSLDYETGTHTTKETPKAAPSRSRNMSLDYEAGTHKAEDGANKVEKKSAPSRTRKMSLDYEAGTHKASADEVAAALDEPVISSKPFAAAAPAPVPEAAVTKGKSKGVAKGASDKQKNSVKEKQRKAQSITEEIDRLTQQKLDLEIERERERAAADAARLSGEQFASEFVESEVWETVGAGKSKKGKKPVAEPTASVVSRAPVASTSAAKETVTISELVAAPLAASHVVAEAASPSSAPAVTSAPVGPPTVQQNVTVPSKKLGHVIGPKGANLIALQDGFGVHIDVPKGEYAGADTMISVSGTSAENVKKVAKAVSDLAVKGYSGLLMLGANNNDAAGASASGEHNNVFMERSMQIPTRIIPDIIGKNGAHIRVLQEKTGCRVTVTNNTNVEGDVSYSRLSMAGTKPQIAQVKDIVKELRQYHHSSVLMPEYIHKELDDALVPEDMYSVLIGTKGSEIKHIQGNFKVSLYIPHDDSQNRHVVLVGSEDCVGAAERYIYKQVAAVQERIAERNLRGFQDVDATSINEREAREQEEELAREPWMQQYVKTSGSDDILQNDFSAIVTKKLKGKK